jgi:hypothetical protein
MADKMTDAQSPAAPGATETKDELIKDAIVKTGELGDGALDQVAGGLKITLKQVLVSSYQLGGSHGDD